MKKDNIKISKLLELFLVFFKLGAVSFGGGYAMVPLIEDEAVQKKKWVEKERIIDIFAVAGTLPGAIGLNSSGLVGYYVAGIPGAVIAMLGNVFPSVIIVLALSMLSSKFSTNPMVQAAFQGIRPAIIGLISFAAYKLGKTALSDRYCYVIALLAFLGMTFLKMNPIAVITLGAVAGVILTNLKSNSKVEVNRTTESTKGGV
jgi:chromate transporter